MNMISDCIVLLLVKVIIVSLTLSMRSPSIGVEEIFYHIHLISFFLSSSFSSYFTGIEDPTIPTSSLIKYIYVFKSACYEP